VDKSGHFMSGSSWPWKFLPPNVFQFPYAIKNWSKCVEASLTPPQAGSCDDWERAVMNIGVWEQGIGKTSRILEVL